MSDTICDCDECPKRSATVDVSSIIENVIADGDVMIFYRNELGSITATRVFGSSVLHDDIFDCIDSDTEPLDTATGDGQTVGQALAGFAAVDEQDTLAAKE